jgi:hypothetical protein
MWRERALKVVLVLVGLLFNGWRLSPDRLFIASGWLGYGRHHDA